MVSDVPRNKRKSFNEDAGRRLKALRLVLGYETMRAFAAELNVREDTYRAWELGISCVPPEWGLVLANRYKITLDWLYRGDAGAMTHELAVKLLSKVA